MRSRFLIAAAAAAALVAAPTPAAWAQAPEASTGCVRSESHTVCRTDPRGGADTSIVEELVAQIDRTGAGDRIRAAAFQWTLEAPIRPLARALVDAKKRGADVRVVVGRYSAKPRANHPLIAELEAAGIGVRQCRGSCLPNSGGGTRGPMHNRFFLIERDRRPTVNVTSFNFTAFHTTQAHNLLAVHGDRGLYDFYSAYWQRLSAGSWKGWGESKKSWWGGGNRAWVFPRSGDAVAEQLARVSGCEAGDKVWVAHTHFQPNRPKVRAQLGRIKRLGCDVKVVVRDSGSNDRSWIAAATGSGGVRGHKTLRGKFIVVDAVLDGTPGRLVYAGTHNLNAHGPKHADDNLLRVRSEAVVGAYEDYFRRLWGRAG